MQPGRYDITIYQRATFELQITLPINLTGHTVIAQIWDEKRRRKYADFDITYVNRAGGIVSIGLDSDITKDLSKPGEWDLMVVYNNTEKQYWLEGNVSIDPGYTDIP